MKLQIDGIAIKIFCFNIHWKYIVIVTVKDNWSSFDKEYCFRKRQSVIVQNCSSNSPVKCEKIDNSFIEVMEDITEKRYNSFMEVDVDDMVVDKTVTKVKLDADIDILAINAMCTKYLLQEENN